MSLARNLLRDQTGAVLVEVTVVITIVFIFVLGSVDFLYAFFQWNLANKAVQVGGRIAAVSDPVASGLQNFSNPSVLTSLPDPGQAMPYAFSVVCDGGAQTCTCTGSDGNVGGTGCTTVTYSTASMNRIVYGRGDTALGCGNATNLYSAGMCDVFGSQLTRANVKITYRQTGLGFVGRPGGPAPTITVELQNMPFTFFFLGGLMGFTNINIPALATAITGEDLCSGVPGSC
jgi:Flp pilus assembly protein TadG